MRASVHALALLAPVLLLACERQQGPVSLSPNATAPAAANDEAEPAGGAMPTPELGYNAREGKALFDHYCSTCHGAEGHGDGFNAFNLDPRPRDLGDPAFQSKRSDPEIAAVIRAGGPSAGLTTGMPPWGRTLNERQIANLVAYLRTLQPAED